MSIIVWWWFTGGQLPTNNHLFLHSVCFSCSYKVWHLFVSWTLILRNQRYCLPGASYALEHLCYNEIKTFKSIDCNEKSETERWVLLLLEDGCFYFILSLPCVTPYIFCLFRSCTDVICCVIFVAVVLSYVALGVVGEHTQGPTGAEVWPLMYAGVHSSGHFICLVLQNWFHQLKYSFVNSWVR